MTGMAVAVTPCTSIAPNRPFDPAWRTETVLLLAKGIDADLAFDRLPILADALEESGCDDLDLLRHCRECDRHEPGCWVVAKSLDRQPHPPTPEPRLDPALMMALARVRSHGGSYQQRTQDMNEVGSKVLGTVVLLLTVVVPFTLSMLLLNGSSSAKPKATPVRVVQPPAVPPSPTLPATNAHP
jgi:hypothetical protein